MNRDVIEGAQALASVGFLEGGGGEVVVNFRSMKESGNARGVNGC